MRVGNKEWLFRGVVVVLLLGTLLLQWKQLQQLSAIPKYVPSFSAGDIGTLDVRVVNSGKDEIPVSVSNRFDPTFNNFRPLQVEIQRSPF